MRFGGSLRPRDVQDGVVHHVITHEAAREECSPVNAGMPLRELGDGRIGMLRLHYADLFQIKGEADGMEVQFADMKGVPLDPSV